MAEPIQRRGLLYVLSSPSGAGKSTIARMLLAADDQIAMSVSATTRPIRQGEVDGTDYHFVDDAEFDRLIASNAFMEWAHVFGNRYGTPRSEVERAFVDGRDVLLDVDWQGAQELKSLDSDTVRVFILPPSLAELEERLRGRGTDSEEVITGRMQRAVDEISHWAEYDYVMVNDDAEVCAAKAYAILNAERLRKARSVGLADFVRALKGKT